MNQQHHKSPTPDDIERAVIEAFKAAFAKGIQTEYGQREVRHAAA